MKIKNLLGSFMVLTMLSASAMASLSVSSTTLSGSSSNPLLIYLSGLPASTTSTTRNSAGVTETVSVTRTSISARFTFVSSTGAVVYPTISSFYGSGTMPYTYILRNAFPYGASTYTLSYYYILAYYSGTMSDGTPYSCGSGWVSSSPALAVGLDAYKFTQNKITSTITGSL